MEQDHLSLLKSIEHEKFPSLNRLSKRYEFYLCGNMKVLGELNRRPRSNFDWV
jgi:predicted translin family RNA/ssDNA-binding protein